MSTNPQPTMAFAEPGKDHIQDVAVLGADGVYRAYWTGMTLEEYQKEKPNLELIDLDKFTEELEQRMTTDPVQITKKRFWYLLEVLPPCGWVNNHSSESFYMSEFTSGRVTQHVVRRGDQYFSFEAPVMRSHADRMKKVDDWLAANPDFELFEEGDDEAEAQLNDPDDIERRLSREEIIGYLEGYGTACYDHESTRLLAECLAETANTEGDKI